MKKFMVLIGIICCCFLAGCGAEDISYDSIRCVKVIDGDTIILADGERVRLTGIDTPETRMNSKLSRDSYRSGKDAHTIISMGKKSTEFTTRMVAGKMVKLEFDIQKRDKYGRLLAYVYIEDLDIDTLPLGIDKEVVYSKRISFDSEQKYIFLNASIVKAGYANLLSIPPNVKYADLLRILYKEARDNNRGLWK